MEHVVPEHVVPCLLFMDFAKLSSALLINTELQSPSSVEHKGVEGGRRIQEEVIRCQE